MATVVSVTETQNSASATSHDINLPATAEGDLLILALTFGSSSGTFTGPSGWSQKAAENRTGGKLRIYAREADGSEGATVSVSNSLFSGHLAAQVYRITGWAGAGSGVGDGNVSANSTQETSATPDPPSHSPSWTDTEPTFWLAIAGLFYPSSITGFPANYADGLATNSDPSSASRRTIATARRELQATSDNPSAFSAGSSGTWGSATLAIRDEAAPEPDDITITAGPTVTYDGAPGAYIGNPGVVTFTAESEGYQDPDQLTYQVRTAAGGGGTLVASGTFTHDVGAEFDIAFDAPGIVDGSQTLYLRLIDPGGGTGEEPFAFERLVALEVDATYEWSIGGPLIVDATFRWSISASPVRVDRSLQGSTSNLIYTFRFERRTKTGLFIDDVTPAISRVHLDLNNNRSILRHAVFTIDTQAVDHRGQPFEWNFLSDHIQVVMELLVDGDTWVDHPMGLYLLSAPSREIRPDTTTLTVRAHDLSIYLQQDLTIEGYMIAAAQNYVSGTGAVRDIFDSLGLKHDIPSTALELPDAMSWDPGTPRMEIVNSLLQGAGMYVHWFDPRGVATSRPLEELAQRTPDVNYRDTDFILVPIQDERDTNRTANRVVVTVTDPDRPGLAGVATNNDPDSPISVQNLGRVITKRLERETAASQDVLDDIAQRELEHSASLYERATLLTSIDPRRSAREVYRLDVDGIYDDQRWWVQSWEVEVEPANPPAIMSHNLGRVVRIAGGVE